MGEARDFLNKLEGIKKTNNILKSMEKPIAITNNNTGIVIPNHSGQHTAGTTGTPVNDNDIANKKYVDDNAGSGGVDWTNATADWKNTGTFKLYINDEVDDCFLIDNNGYNYMSMNTVTGSENISFGNNGALFKIEASQISSNVDLDIDGDITVSGTVDGIDIATDVAANTAKTGITTTQASNITTNNAKVTNQTHTGEVTGSTALTISDNIIDEANLKLETTPTNDYVLTADSTKSGGMKWATSSSGFSDPMTTRGDIIYKNSSNSTTRLPIGTDGQVLTSDGTDLSWEDASGGSNTTIFLGHGSNWDTNTGYFFNEDADGEGEDAIKQTMPKAGTWKNTYIWVWGSDSTSTVSVKSRINGADGNQSVSLTAGTTGQFSDTTNSDSVSVGDELSYSISSPGTGKSISLNMSSEYSM